MRAAHATKMIYDSDAERRAFFRVCACADFIEQHEHIYVVEQNRDAQMLSLLKLDLKPELITRLRSIAHITGLPLDARSITDELTSMEGK